MELKNISGSILLVAGITHFIAIFYRNLIPLPSFIVFLFYGILYLSLGILIFNNWKPALKITLVAHIIGIVLVFILLLFESLIEIKYLGIFLVILDIFNLIILRKLLTKK